MFSECNLFHVSYIVLYAMLTAYFSYSYIAVYVFVETVDIYLLLGKLHNYLCGTGAYKLIQLEIWGRA